MIIHEHKKSIVWRWTENEQELQLKVKPRLIKLTNLTKSTIIFKNESPYFSRMFLNSRNFDKILNYIQDELIY